jgi:hypothetical protein
MKAFKIKWIGEPELDGYYAAQSAAKAKAQAVDGLLESGYAQDFQSGLAQLAYCRRIPELDAWASQFRVTASKSQELVCCSILQKS